MIKHDQLLFPIEGLAFFSPPCNPTIHYIMTFGAQEGNNIVSLYAHAVPILNLIGMTGNDSAVPRFATMRARRMRFPGKIQKPLIAVIFTHHQAMPPAFNDNEQTSSSSILSWIYRNPPVDLVGMHHPQVCAWPIY